MHDFSSYESSDIYLRQKAFTGPPKAIRYVVLGLVLTLVSIIVAQPPRHKDETMFGLRWGMSPLEVVKQGVLLMEHSSDGYETVYTSNSLPRNVAISVLYALRFDEDSSLFAIRMIGRTIHSDQFGTRGKEQFNAFRHRLANRYEFITDIRQMGRAEYRKANEFYQCLAHPKCGQWSTWYKSKNSDIILILRGEGPGRGYLEINTTRRR